MPKAIRDTKTELLDFAQDAVMSRGFDAFSYADMADAVGIRKASIHYYFPTKATLSVALVDRYHERFQVKLEDFAQTSASGAEHLSKIIDEYRANINGGRTVCMCISFAVTKKSMTEEVMEKIEEFRLTVRNALTDAFTTGQRDGTIASDNTAETEALFALTLLEGAHLAARFENDVAAFERAVAPLRARLTASGGGD